MFNARQICRVPLVISQIVPFGRQKGKKVEN